MTWMPINYIGYKAPTVPISAPPCPSCQHWAPQVEFMPTPLGFEPCGIVYCHAEKMVASFSCFELRGS